MDDSRFDALTQSLFAPRSRRSLAAMLGIAGVLGSDAGSLTKNKGKGKKGKHKKKKKFCVSEGESCTFSVNPCCGDSLCCDPAGTGFHECVPRDLCCSGITCSTGHSSE